MSPGFEAALARLYTDEAALRRFLADPRREAARAGLRPAEIEALVLADPVALRLASQSFARKRAQSSRGPKLRRLLGRLRGWLRAWPYVPRRASAIRRAARSVERPSSSARR